ncbi:hypothetical protein M758_1G194400 [Ceratodon purpureus]|uniref:Uncharacterized protein n=1 Tax=Ceratodon purpureus TaxID=3225 RepID=A0A8T0JBA7_CERPU|nr:hypothetical protein KC19_1G226700 [Ceratodon purpureus]KAG0630658.1 hypothetical protein M758_1G194400 [Ceratodon purpureus]
MTWLNTSDAKSANNDEILVTDTANYNSYVLDYTVTISDNAPTVDRQRQRLRMQGLRFRMMFCRNALRLHVLPLRKSQSHAVELVDRRHGQHGYGGGRLQWTVPTWSSQRPTLCVI